MSYETARSLSFLSEEVCAESPGDTGASEPGATEIHSVASLCQTKGSLAIRQDLFICQQILRSLNAGILRSDKRQDLLLDVLLVDDGALGDRLVEKLVNQGRDRCLCDFRDRLQGIDVMRIDFTGQSVCDCR
jgi:hypothetical protein